MLSVIHAGIQQYVFMPVPSFPQILKLTYIQIILLFPTTVDLKKLWNFLISLSVVIEYVTWVPSGVIKVNLISYKKLSDSY